MRLDLFLKIARIIKRRSGAREMCEDDRVLVNGRTAKPAKEVRPGDSVTLLFPSRRIELEILATPDDSTKKHLPRESLCRIKSETRLTQEKEPWSGSLS